MIPTREKAMQLLIEAEKMNPGSWMNHSIVTGECAYKIAEKCKNLDAERAYVSGVLHDIGRRFGIKYLAHTIEGYNFMKSLGYDEIAKICITHSFTIKDINTYIGKKDVSEKDLHKICELLDLYQYDDYDLLIQLCDSISTGKGPVDIEVRLNDVKQRYGYYPQNSWDKRIELKEYFENKLGKQLFEVINKIECN